MQLFDEIEKALPYLSAQFTEKELIRFSQCDYKNLSAYCEAAAPWISTHLLQESEPLYQLFLQGGIYDRQDMAAILLHALHILLRT